MYALLNGRKFEHRLKGVGSSKPKLEKHALFSYHSYMIENL